MVEISVSVDYAQSARHDTQRGVDRLRDPVSNILTDDIIDIVQRLRTRQRANDCRACWTSGRGSIEALMDGRQPWLNLRDYWRMTRPVGLRGTF